MHEIGSSSQLYLYILLQIVITVGVHFCFVSVVRFIILSPIPLEVAGCRRHFGHFLFERGPPLPPLRRYNGQMAQGV